MAVSAVVADWTGARYLDGNEESLEEYMTQSRVEANMNTDEYTLTAFALNTDEGVIVQYRGKDYKFTVEITESGNSAKVTYGSSEDSDNTPITEGWIQNDDGTITDGNVTLNIGDYINYNHIDGATVYSYTSYATKTGHDTDQMFNLNSYTSGWRVLGVEDGKLKIISEELIQPDSGGYEDENNNMFYYLYGQIGYQNAETELNSICSLYGQGAYAESARSVIVDDIDKITGYNPVTDFTSSIDKTLNTVGNIFEYGVDVTYYWNGSNQPYYSCSNGANGILISHNNFFWYDFNSESWKNSSYSTNASELNMEKIVTLKNTLYSYLGSDYLTNSSEIYKLIFNDSTEYGREGYTDSTSGWSYWLASYCNFGGDDPDIDDYDYAYYGIHTIDGNAKDYAKLNRSTGIETGDHAYIRPVIILQSNITLTEKEDGSYDISI